MKYVVVGRPKTEFFVGDIPVWEDGLRRSRHTDRRKGGRDTQTDKSTRKFVHNFEINIRQPSIFLDPPES